jgi:segregation and condensation protein A
MADVPPPESTAESQLSAVGPAERASGGVYRVELPTFEGPLDLLLHLIEEHELDVRDIPIAFIAQKYVQYILLMQELNIDIASEYLVMAATLAHIKSKILLPTPPAGQDEEDEDEADPRAELVRRLLEYQKYKHAAEQLSTHDLLGRDVFRRGIPAPQADGPAALGGLSLFKLLDAFQNVLARAKTVVDHEIDFERFSISDRINELCDVLRAEQRMTFDQLFAEQRSRADLIITFLALLEMTRLRLTRLFQDGPLEMIYVELAVSDGFEARADADPGDARDVASELGDQSDEIPSAEPSDDASPDEVMIDGDQKT